MEPLPTLSALRGAAGKHKARSKPPNVCECPAPSLNHMELGVGRLGHWQCKAASAGQRLKGQTLGLDKGTNVKICGFLPSPHVWCFRIRRTSVTKQRKSAFGFVNDLSSSVCPFKPPLSCSSVVFCGLKMNLKRLLKSGDADVHVLGQVISCLVELHHATASVMLAMPVVQ